ncbi:uncharacterized protein DUF4190 [Streptomyces sp. Amel2xB2]|uniref:DUF4190 domain-containing protein n=1 Tax=Streptomyces sp. Amel2xB2 TaxID=1305829 RepID=UPI000DC0127A|nr:DUF4190 domain-containing protein [Streptomyces sp. Amel2xB2]RAJ63517.1 uncharacterized protein DUF4190 [Streptomyces sp. Amel2xB2]
MADETGRPGRSGGGEEHNPWAPPRDGAAPGRGSMDQNDAERKRRSVADQPTVTSGSASVPPPVPPAPGAPPAAPPGAGGGGYGGQGHGAAPGPSAYAGPAPYGAPSPYQQRGGHQQFGAGGAAYGYPPAGQQPYGYGASSLPSYGWHGPPPTGKPVAAMVFGIIGLVAVLTCWGSFLAIILSPIALGLGHSARKEADRGESGGRGQAVAGFVMGIIGTVLSVICVAFLVVMMVFYSEELERGPGYGGGDGSSLDARERASAAPALPGAVTADAADRGA